jgi:hypothetical protein
LRWRWRWRWAPLTLRRLDVPNALAVTLLGRAGELVNGASPFAWWSARPGAPANTLVVIIPHCNPMLGRAGELVNWGNVGGGSKRAASPQTPRGRCQPDGRRHGDDDRLDCVWVGRVRQVPRAAVAERAALLRVRRLPRKAGSTAAHDALQDLGRREEGTGQPPTQVYFNPSAGPPVQV